LFTACEKETLYIDSFAGIIIAGSSWIDQVYELKCRDGYTAIKETGSDILNHVTVTCNKGTGSWEGTDFFCKS